MKTDLQTAVTILTILSLIIAAFIAEAFFGRWALLVAFPVGGLIAALGVWAGGRSEP